jgi:hypothetical protein
MSATGIVLSESEHWFPKRFSCKWGEAGTGTPQRQDPKEHQPPLPSLVFRALTGRVPSNRLIVCTFLRILRWSKHEKDLSAK